MQLTKTDIILGSTTRKQKTIAGNGGGTRPSWSILGGFGECIWGWWNYGGWSSVGSRKIMMNECKRRAEAEWEQLKWVLGDLFQGPLGDMQIWHGQRWWDRNFSDFSGPLVDSDETINYFTRVIVIYGDHLWILSTQMSKQDDHFYYKSFPWPPANAIRRSILIDGSICILFIKNPTVQNGIVEFIIRFI